MKTLGSITENERRQSFLDWVESYRSVGFNMDEELRKCPVIWCREKFNNKEMAARHVLHCPYLSNGWYWCPYHTHPERFLEPSLQDPLQEKRVAIYEKIDRRQGSKMLTKILSLFPKKAVR